MNMRLHWLAVLALALAGGNTAAAPLDFDGNPISCTDPAGATVPIPCADTAAARSDGYSFIGYSFNFIIPPPVVPPLPFPQIAQNDSERDFINPVMQDLLVWIFGNTKVDVDGAPVLFFVNGTLDGVIVTTFSTVVSGHDNHLSWGLGAVVEDVPAGEHTLDMHFGVMQLAQQPSQVNVSSLYQVTVNPVAEPATLLLVLAASAFGFAPRPKARAAFKPAARAGARFA